MPKHTYIRAEIPGRGRYTTTAEALDELLAEKAPFSLPALKRDIRHVAREELGFDDEYLASVDSLKTITECLLVLAELTGRGI